MCEGYIPCTYMPGSLLHTNSEKIYKRDERKYFIFLCIGRKKVCIIYTHVKALDNPSSTFCGVCGHKNMNSRHGAQIHIFLSIDTKTVYKKIFNSISAAWVYLLIAGLYLFFINTIYNV